MPWVGLVVRGTSHTFQEVEEHQEPSNPSRHALGFRKLAKGALTSGQTKMADGKQPFSSVLVLKITSQRQAIHVHIHQVV